MKRRLFTIMISVALIAVLLASCLFAYGCEKEGGVVGETYEYATYGYVSDGEVDISIGILADVHVMAETQAVDMSCEDFKSWEAHGQKMLGLSESILKTTVDRIIAESDFDVILVSGDNADDGGEVSHRLVAAELKRLEDAGIKVFTIPGNHDINNKSYTYAGGTASYTNPTSEAEFASIYADFGYNTTDTLEFYKHADASGSERHNATFAIGDNLSYVADLSDEYRLIAIDMCNYVANDYLRDTDGSYAAAGYDVDDEGYVLLEGERYPVLSGYLRDTDGSYAAAGWEVNAEGYVLDKDGKRISIPGRHDGAMTEDLLLWAEEQTKAAVLAGKTPIGMMHFPLIHHLGSLVTAENAAVNDPDGYVVADVLADAGMRYIFTGHIHMQDDAIYTSKKGKKILDVNSASLCNYPTPVRYFRAKGDDVFVRTWNMDRVEESYLPDYLSEAEKTEILSDFRAYSVDYINGSMLAKIKNKVDLDLINKAVRKILDIKDGVTNADAAKLATDIYNDVFLKFLNMPLYKRNAAKGQQSVESIAKSYGVTIPSSGYKTIFELAMSYAADVYGGDESADSEETRAALLKYSVYSAIRVIADFDLFGKLHALKETIPAISLIATVKTLFKTGVLDVCENGLLRAIPSLVNVSMVENFLDFSVPYKMLSFIKNNINGEIIKSAIKGLLPENISAAILGMNLGSYIVVSEANKVGGINLKKLFDEALFGTLTLGLMNDSIEGHSVYSYKNGETDTAPADNNLVIKTNTMAYSTLE